MVSALWANSDEVGSILERSDMAFRDFGCAPQLVQAAGVMVSLRRGPAQPQLWVRAGFARREKELNGSGFFNASKA
jgi:hypothetical protein